jgi:predicted RND superfamily exporter protein
MEKLSRVFAEIAGWCFDHRWLVSGICLALFLGSIVLGARVQQDASYEAYFDEDDTTYQAYEAYRDDFGSDEIAYVGFELPGVEHGPWNVDAMAKLVELTGLLEDEVPFVYSVTSLANAELTIGNEDGIEISRVRDLMPLSQAALLDLRRVFLKKPLLVGGIINEDANFGAILIKMDRSSPDPPEELIWDPEKGEDLENMYPQIAEAKIAEILARPKFEDFVFYISGDVPINAYFNRILFFEPMFLMLIGLVVISTILLISFRSWVSVVTPALVLLLTISMTVAMMVVFGFKIDLSFSSTPTLLMAIGVAHSVHILSEFRTQFLILRDRREALIKTIYLVGVPCMLTCVTTAVAFASMSFVPIKSIARGAIYQSFGVVVAFLLSLTLLMALLSFGRRVPREAEDRVSERRQPSDLERSAIKGWLAAIAQFNIRHPRALILGFSIFILVSGMGASQVGVDSNSLNDFWEDSPIRRATVRVDDEMGGVTNIVYLFDGGAPDAIKDPAVLREIERLESLAGEEDWLVRKTYSIVGIVKDLNQAFHAGDPAFLRIPESREAVAQLLLLYESAGGDEVEEYVSSDYRHANLELRLRLAPTAATARLIDRLHESLAAKPLEVSSVSLTGIGALWLKLLGFIVSSQIQGFSIAFATITLMMIAVFRSVKIGLISMIPNLAPVLLALGAMGWLGIPLDYNKVMVAAIALGISVDDTIHLMTRFQHEFALHKSYEKALRRALGDVGRALLITSLALILGFLVLIFSELRSQAYYGLLLSGALMTALVADFFFMPALVLWLQPFGPEGASASEAAKPQMQNAA